jgi:hypothetical protein
MAKSTGAGTSPTAPIISPTVDRKVEEFAEDLGRLLGTARAKADDWLSQRNAIVKHLEGVRDTANQLLQQLGIVTGSAAQARPAAGVRQRGPGRPPRAAAADATPARKKFTMSAEAREKIAAAQRARWAKQKAGKK